MSFPRIAIVGAIVAVLGYAGWYFVGPLLFDTVVSEELAEADTIARGRFVDADSVHKGRGNVVMVQRSDGVVELQFSGFEVTNGPDLVVWLSDHPDPKMSEDVADSQYLSLGDLKGNVGDQAYEIPAGTDLNTYKSVAIWCKRFGVLFSPARLSDA